MNQIVGSNRELALGATGIAARRGGWKAVVEAPIDIEQAALPVFVRDLCERIAPLITPDAPAVRPARSAAGARDDTPTDIVGSEIIVDVERLKTTLLQALLDEETGALSAARAGLQSAHAAFPVLFDNVLNPVMRLLGEMWEDDDANFVEVTVALSRMHTLLHDLTNASAFRAARPQDRDPVLLARMNGEDHTLGLIAVSTCFARAGWDVQGGADMETGPALLAALDARSYSFLGISVGSVARIDELTEAMRAARRASRNSSLIIGLGGPPVTAQPDLFESAGADFVANSAMLAVERASELTHC